MTPYSLVDRSKRFGADHLLHLQGTLSANYTKTLVNCVWNVTAHAQKPDFVFRRNGRVHLNRLGRLFSRLLSAEVCASAVVILETLCSKVVWRVLATHSIRKFPLHFPLPCVTVCHHVSIGLYISTKLQGVTCQYTVLFINTDVTFEITSTHRVGPVLSTRAFSMACSVLLKPKRIKP
jgi:hypothetical protein